MRTGDILISEKIAINGSFLVGLSLLTATSVSSQVADSGKPNVIIIYADDLGYGDLGCYGATKVRTSNIDKLAEDGRLFTDMHVCSSVSTPSRYSLLTGEYAFRKEIYGPAFDKQDLLIDTGQVTIADVFKGSGYTTAIIGKWHLGFGKGAPDWNGELKPGPLELGFDYYFGVPTVNSHPPFVYVENHSVVGLESDDPFVYGKRAETKVFDAKRDIDKIGGARAAHALYDDEMVGTTLTMKAVEWIKTNKDKPFFLYFPTTNIHHPFTPHPRFIGTSDCGIYGDFIHELDWMVGEIVKTLKEENLEDETIIIFTSDNGGMVNGGGQEAIKAGHTLNGKLLGFKFDAWEGGHRVPMIIKWPGKIKAGSKSSQLISNVDILHSFASLLGYKLKEDDAVDSYNMLPVIMGTTRKELRDHLVIAPFRKSNLTLRHGKWIFIGAQGGGGFAEENLGDNAFGGPPALKFAGQVNSDFLDGQIKPDAPKTQLYNLKKDLSQARNMAEFHPAVTSRMETTLNKIKSGTRTRP